MPVGKDAYATDPEHPYEAFDPKAGHALPGWFVVGWARKPSEGLVGNARMDGERGVAEVLHYLEQAPEKSGTPVSDLPALLRQRGIPVITQTELAALEKVEACWAAERGLHSFKFPDNTSMLAAIEDESRKP